MVIPAHYLFSMMDNGGMVVFHLKMDCGAQHLMITMLTFFGENVLMMDLFMVCFQITVWKQAIHPKK